MDARRITVEVLTSNDVLDTIGDDWDRLWAEAEAPSPMLEAAWVRRWWRDHASATAQPYVVVLRDETGRRRAIAPLYRRRPLDPLANGLRTVQFLGMGEAERDEVRGEYLGWLGSAAWSERLSVELSALLVADRSWDRLCLTNLAPGSRIPDLVVEALRPRLAAIDLRVSPTFLSPIMPLERYLAALKSSKLRHKLRRSIKEAAARGVSFQRATSLTEARAMMASLVELHQRQWTARGLPGVFASAVFRSFHDDILAHYGEGQRLWLVGLRQGESLIAARYLIAVRGRIYDYISGIALEGDNLLNPGMLLHLWTIDEAARAGCKVYDFMGGDYDYKRRLAFEESHQVTVDLFARNVRAVGWLVARAGRRWYRRRRGLAPTNTTAGTVAGPDA